MTDTLQLIASGLCTVPTVSLLDWLSDYLATEQVDTILIGEPLHLDGEPARMHSAVIGLSRTLRKRFPQVDVLLRDERFTSVEAREILWQSGARRKTRQDKGLLDQISAAILLQAYLDHRPPVMNRPPEEE